MYEDHQDRIDAIERRQTGLASVIDAMSNRMESISQHCHKLGKVVTQFIDDDTARSKATITDLTDRLEVLETTVRGHGRILHTSGIAMVNLEADQQRMRLEMQSYLSDVQDMIGELSKLAQSTSGIACSTVKRVQLLEAEIGKQGE